MALCLGSQSCREAWSFPLLPWSPCLSWEKDQPALSPDSANGSSWVCAPGAACTQKHSTWIISSDECRPPEAKDTHAQDSSGLTLGCCAGNVWWGRRWSPRSLWLEAACARRVLDEGLSVSLVLFQPSTDSLKHSLCWLKGNRLQQKMSTALVGILLLLLTV